MPNGIDKNLVRLATAVESFHERFGDWPDHALLNEISLRDVRLLLGPDFLSVVERKLRLVPAADGFRVADAQGRWFDYARGSYSDHSGPQRHAGSAPPPMPGWHWLGLTDWHGPPGHTPSWRDHF